MDSINDFFTLMSGGWIVLAIVGSALACLLPAGVIGLIAFMIVRNKNRADALRAAAQTWPSTAGRVLRSFVEVSRTGDGHGGTSTHYTPNIIYEYWVDGMLYRNDRLDAGGPMIKVKSYLREQEVVDRYPEGSTVQVFYNPANPQESMLER